MFSEGPKRFSIENFLGQKENFRRFAGEKFSERPKRFSIENFLGQKENFRRFAEEKFSERPKWFSIENFLGQKENFGQFTKKETANFAVSYYGTLTDDNFRRARILQPAPRP